MGFGPIQTRGQPVTIKDEGISLTQNVNSIDFAGAGVTSASVGADVTETIPGGGGGGAFTDLTDVPANYTGASLKVVRVNVGETALEFTTAGAGTITGSGNANEIAYFTGASAIASLAVATYPSLTELAYVKGVTSAIQTQLNGKLATGLAVLTDQTSGQTIGATGARLTKLWATDITVTNAIVGSVTGNAGTVTNATLTTTLTNNGGAGTLTWPVAGATLTIPTGGGTLGSAAFTDSTAYLAAGGTAVAVTGATFTTALTVNGGTLTLTANVANNSVLTIGAGAVSVSGANTGDNASNSSSQPVDATLTALAGLTIAADSLSIGTGADAFTQVTFAANTFPAKSSAGALVAKTITDFGLSLVDDTDATTARTTLGLVIGTNVQAYDADLTTWAGITPGTGVGTALAVNVGSAGAFTTFNGALGTPSSGTGTNITGIPAANILAGTFGAGAYILNGLIYTNNAITASGNAATVPVTHRLSTVTNNSAATLTITITTAGATDGQMLMVRILDFSAVAQTITWVNTENSTVTAPTTSNGSTTLFLTVGFIYNGGTSKWRCIASC
jgi:hypothetical protein